MAEPPEPFRGGSEWIIKRALAAAGPGLVEGDRLLAKADLFVTNVVHCHPPDNRKSEPHEIANCARFLRRELALVQPRLVVGFGDDTRDWLMAEVRAAPVLGWRPFTPPNPAPPGGPVLLLMPHPSRMRFRPATERQEWIDALTDALRWGFRERRPGHK